MRNKLFEKIKGRLVVSCQAEGDSPFNNPEDVAKFAICAQMGGASAIRTEGVGKARAIRQKVDLPLIGLIKSQFEDGSVLITPTEKDVKDLIDVGCDIVAIDGTFRMRNGTTGPDFIRHILKTHDVIVMADISNYDEAIACAAMGVHCISTTLSGYTPETAHINKHIPDFELLEQLVRQFGNNPPVIAEGRINTPELAAKAIKMGAWAVVSGTAITRPQTITKWFYDAIEQRI